MAKNTQTKNTWWDNVKNTATHITVISIIASIGYGVGCWKSHVEHQQVIMTITQQHNKEMADQKMDYNQKLLEAQVAADKQIIELKNELSLIRLTNNTKNYGK